MICQPCRDGADYLSKGGVLETARQFHDECTDCDCQHKVEQHGQVVRK